MRKITITREFTNGELVKETVVEELVDSIPAYPTYPVIQPWYVPAWYCNGTTTTISDTTKGQ